ncbi:MAG: hypothetical protein CL470_09150 [Acidimicrobiaceae bacterium]|nr:hypothetical protein [Acidimicrobiaceae bacterium]
MSEQGPIILGGRYELQRRLARGGMAEVFLAQDQLLGRPVAVKVLFPEFATDPSFVERFRREAQAAANLSHPNIVGVYDWGREGKTYYIVMEYVEGRSLSEIIRSEGPLPAVQAAEIAKEIAAALGFAHKNDVVHRDMKSGNVIVSDSGQIKVADFGIATAISGNGQTNLTQTGAVMGTATYFSPEQAQGKQLDGRSDLYSLGIVMYEMLTGAPPFSGDSPVSIAYKHVQEQPELISTKRPGVADALQAITAKLLNKEPDQRYSRAEDLQSDLEKFLSGWHSLGPEGLSEETSPVQPVVGPIEAATTQVNPVSTETGPRDPNYPGPPYPPQYFEPYERHDRRIWLWGLLTVGLLVALVALIIVLMNAIGGSSDSDPEPVPVGTPSAQATDGVIVPFVVDLGRDQAVALLQARGLEVGRLTTEIRTDIPSDRIISQTPEPGSEIKIGEAVDLVVSVGPEAKQVPVAVGLTQEEAINRLQNEGFQNIEIYTIKTNDYDLGVVAEQEPEAGSALEPNNAIIIRVSDGRISDVIPNLIGRNRSEIDEQLIQKGWTVIIEEVEVEDAADEVDVILSISPDEGTDYSLEEVVTVQVSVGPSTVTVPAVIGLTAEAAAVILDEVGLFVDPPTDCEVDPESPSVGRVTTQDPESGSSVDPGSSVTICIGVATEPEPTPTPEP